MAILFGHPTGNPNSYNSALAHFEAGRLDAFCVPWMPSPMTLRILERMRPFRAAAQRLGRRRFPALAGAPKVQGRIGEAKGWHSAPSVWPMMAFRKKQMNGLCGQ